MGDMDLIRPLGLAGIECAAVAYAEDPTRFSRFTRAWVKRYDAWDEQARQVEELLRFARAQPSPPVLFYGGDPQLLIVAQYQDVLRDWFSFVVPSTTLVLDLVDKARFRRLSKELGLPVPRSWHLRPASEAVPESRLVFPLLVKPLTRQEDVWGRVGGSAKAVRVDTPDDLRTLWPQLAALQLEVLAQETIPGPEARIESYHAYIDDDGQIAGEFTGQKIRTLPVEYGHSTALTTTNAPDVAALGRDIVSRVGLRGSLVKVDFKRAPDGALRLFEINPRFSLWHHLGAVAGVNLPALVYADVVGLERPVVTRARAGVTWVLPRRDLTAARESGIPLRTWLAWMARCQAKSVLAWDDPMPFLRGQVMKRILPGAGRTAKLASAG
jgi:D-aspartate ligase